MKVKNFIVKRVDSKDIKSLIEKWHYSGSIKGVNTQYCFGLYHNQVLIGAIIYGQSAMPNTWKKYVNKKEDLIELRRLCCIDDTPKNTESYFIAKTIKWIKKNTNIKKILSYSDLTYGHEGVVYKASNFKQVGETKEGKIIKDLNTGKTYHDRVLRSKKNGHKKPIAMKLEFLLNSKRAIYVKGKGKNIYIYEVRK